MERGTAPRPEDSRPERRPASGLPDGKLAGPGFPIGESPAADLDLTSEHLVSDLWDHVRGQLQDLGVSAVWLDRLHARTLRRGVLSLGMRGRHVSRWVRQQYEPLIRRIACQALGTPIQVRIDVDHSLGSALTALGMPFQAAPPAPPPFVPRPENKMAHAALLKLARGESQDWNRVLLMGPEGTGKTHLLNLFRHQRHRHHPRERWRQARTTELVREFLRASRERRRTEFRGNLLLHDGLILDVAEDLSGKIRFQEVLVDVLEHYRSQGRIVLVAARSLPESAKELLPQLRSLLGAGLRLRLPELSVQSRVEILRQRAGSEVPEWLAEELGRSRVALERALYRCRQVRKEARGASRPLSPTQVRALVPELVREDRTRETMEMIIRRAAEYAGAEVEAVVGGARTRAAALGRHLALYLALERLGLPRRVVQRWFGNLASSVVPYVRRKVEAMAAQDPRLMGFLREVGEEAGGQRYLFS